MGSQIPPGGTPFAGMGGGMGGGVNPLAQSIQQGVNFQPPPMALPQRPGMGMGAPQPQPQLDMDAITQQVLRYIYDNPGALSAMADAGPLQFAPQVPVTQEQRRYWQGRGSAPRGEGGDSDRSRGTSSSRDVGNARADRGGGPY